MTKDKKTLFIILGIIGTVAIIAILIAVIAFSNKDESPIENPEPNVPEKIDEDKIGKEILTSLDIDDFVANAFNVNTEVNKELISVSDELTFINLFMQNDEIEKFHIVFDSKMADMIYIKYTDFIKYSDKTFSAEPSYEYKNISLTFPNITKNKIGKYDLPKEGVGLCNFKTDVNDCYVLIGSGNVEFNSTADFSKLKVTENTITGNVIKYYDESDKSTYIDGTFVFEYEKKSEDKYIAKSFKITKINEQ